MGNNINLFITLNFVSEIFTIAVARIIKKLTDGRYNQCSAITAFNGTILDTGSNVIKNQRIAKDAGLEDLYNLTENITRTDKRIIEVKTCGSKIDLANGIFRSICRLNGKKSNLIYWGITLQAVSNLKYKLALVTSMLPLAKLKIVNLKNKYIPIILKNGQ